MQDDGGDVLGNLPRSRPGRRSEKRTGGTAKRSAPAKGSGPAAKKAGGKKAASSSAKRTTAKKRAPGNPVEDALRAATRVAETGLRVAEGVTREVLRRLPRP